MATEDSKALDKGAAKAVRGIHRQVVRRALRRLENAAEMAMGIDDDGLLVPEPMRDMHVAKDLRKNKRDAPNYIGFLLQRTEFAEKLEAARESENKGVVLNIGTVAVQVVSPEYPRIKVDGGSGE